MIEKFIYQPVSPWHINQNFGENCSCVNDAGQVVTIPNGGTCPVGYHGLYAPLLGHNGLDLMAKRWQEVYAAHDGVVNELQTEIARGLGIGIITNKQYFCKETGKPEYFKTRYWHFIAMDVHIGDKVKAGDLIGYADSTGYSSGDHLHFELKPVTLSGANILQTNGYNGAIDPLPYMENYSALQYAGLIRQITELTAKIANLLADKLRGR